MKRTVVIAVAICVLGCKEKTNDEQPQAEVATQETATQQSNWVTLFDGSTFNGWHYYNGGEVGEPWAIEDGAMVFTPPTERPNGESYNLVSDADYTNFVLSLEWKVTEGANSGIFWGILEDEKFGQPYETGPEIQVLDDERHPDAKNGTTHQAGALYDMIAPSEKTVKPAGEWNLCVLTIDHHTNRGEVALNGVDVVSFPVHGEEWDAMVENSKFKGWEGFGKYRTGKVGLQDHGDKVFFRNIKIKPL